MSGALRHVLLGTDFSEPATTAAAWASALASAHGARLTVVHVHQPLGPMVIGSGVMPVPDEAQARLREAAEARLAEVVQGMKAEGLDPQPHLVTGIAPTRLIEAAEELDVDVIVVATRGHSGFRRSHLGHTVANVVGETDRPVLVVHPEDEAEVRRVRTVLVPTDFSEDSGRAAHAAVDLLGPSIGDGARIVLVHAYHAPHEMRLLLGPGDLLEDAARTVEREARAALEAEARRLSREGLTVDLELHEGPVADVIEREAKRVGADMIAMATHVYSGFRQLLARHTAERLLPHAPCPVLTVRAGDRA